MSAARTRRAGRLVLAIAVVTGIAVGAASARADAHDPEQAGHPVRIAAYVLHPIGVAFDYLIMRPAHWLVNREPFSTIFGHDE